MIEHISEAGARRMALAAQGLGRPRPGTVGPRSVAALLRRIHLLQIDSVNVFERSHYLPVFARLGAYDRGMLDRMLLAPGTGYTEQLAHEAAFLPVGDLPLLGWRMRANRRRLSGEGSWAEAHRDLLDHLRALLAAEGPTAASQIDHEANGRTGPWWGWSDVKIGLETLFRWGEVAIAGRSRFQRRYALAEQVLPAEVLDVRIDEADAVRELIRRAARAHGLGTLTDLADYYRVPKSAAARAVRELEDAGELIPIEVVAPRSAPERRRPERVWRHRDARRARGTGAAALLSPFDPVVWQRERAERLFGLHYRIEIYTPAAKRVYGYYVLPVVIDDRIVARVDLKSDRQAGVLRVQSAWLAPGTGAHGAGAAHPTPVHPSIGHPGAGHPSTGETAERLAGLLREAAAWQGLGEVTVTGRGDLAAELARAVRAAV